MKERQSKAEQRCAACGELGTRQCFGEIHGGRNACLHYTLVGLRCKRDEEVVGLTAKQCA